MTTNHTEIIKDKLSILDVVSSYVSLEKAGKTWKGKSPFTNEKTPSFFVSPDKGFFYCFSSGKGGDIFNFIQEIERVDFREALKMLADRAGVDLGDQGESSSINKVLYKILDDATKWYEVNLRKNKKAVDYLLERGLSKDTIVKFRLGFAQDSWQDIYDYLKKKGYSDQNIELCGLITKKEGGRGFYDRFRSRIMFPLMDSRGRVVGFSGRIFSDNPDEKGAKYVNSPDGPLFDKSKILYGYHSAKSEISKRESCILVEGQFDVLMAQQAGSVNTVAVSGTGLTDDHIAMIKRFANTILLSFDSDNAGIKATKRSVLKAYEHGLAVKVIVLPFGEDPADIIKSGSSKWQVFVADAKDYVDYRLELFDSQNPKARFEEKHKLVTEELFDFVYLLKSSVVQDKVLQDLALFLGVNIEALRKDFDVYKPSDELSNLHDSKKVVVRSPAPTPEVKDHKDVVKDSIVEYSVYLENQHADKWADHYQKINTLFAEVYGQSIQEAAQSLSQEQREMLMFKLNIELQEKHIEQVLNDLDLQIKQQLKRFLDTRSHELMVEIRTAEHQGDHERLLGLQHENLEIRKRIDSLT